MLFWFDIAVHNHTITPPSTGLTRERTKSSPAFPGNDAIRKTSKRTGRFSQRRTTLLVVGLIWVSGMLIKVTQTNPCPTEISPPRPGTPASIVATTSLLAVSIRETVPSP
ncbi:hypothetical protein ABH975_006854 [Bradyrhizobium ottawaense]